MITLFLSFLILFVLGVLLLGSIDYLIKCKKAQQRYIRRLQLENAHLKRTNAFLKVALNTKGGKK